MTRSFLFGGASSSQSQNKYLVEFRAGKMSMKSNKVSADKRKGLVYVYQTDDSLMHFCWKDRTSGAVEDDLIIFPDDVVFKKVPECTTGRVFVLKFKSSSRRCFYWLQEPKTDRDTEYCTKVNQYLNNPPAAGSSRSGGSGSLGGSSTPSHGGAGLQSELSSLGDSDLQNLLNNMSQQQLIQLLGADSSFSSGVGVGGMPSLSSLLGASRPSSGQSASSASESTTTRTPAETTQPSRTSQSSTPRTTQASSVTTTPTPAPSATPSSASSIQLSDLQNILSGLSVPAQAATAAESSSSKPAVDLSSAITAEALQPLFTNKDLMDRIKALLPPRTDATSPSGVDNETLRSTVQSPQFQQLFAENREQFSQALGMFSAALSSGQLGPLMQQFGMSTDVVSAANSGDMEAFVKAMQKSKESSSGGSKGDKKDQDKDKDEDMNLD